MIKFLWAYLARPFMFRDARLGYGFVGLLAQMSVTAGFAALGWVLCRFGASPLILLYLVCGLYMGRDLAVITRKSTGAALGLAVFGAGPVYLLPWLERVMRQLEKGEAGLFAGPGAFFLITAMAGHIWFHGRRTLGLCPENEA